MPEGSGYRIVKLPNGSHSVHALAYRETFHPVVGPVAEAEALYVRQLGIPERLRAAKEQFVAWDVGLGAAANALTLLHACQPGLPGLHLVSFDHTLEPLRFALAHRDSLLYLAGHEERLAELLQRKQVEFEHHGVSVRWEVHEADFPALIAQPNAALLPKPHLVMFDAFSPATNPEMWTLPLFTRLFAMLDPGRPCAMPTYSRSTLLRTTLLLAGFYVGAGHATGEKEETTVAANSLDLVREPLDRRWLERARRSSSAEPLHEGVYRQAPLSEETWARLRQHPQFA